MRAIILPLLLVYASNSFAQVKTEQSQQGVISSDGSVVRLQSRVTGNQEQPSVLSIVPWKEASDRTRIDQGVQSDISSLFQHLDDEALDRQIYFYKQFSGQAPSGQTH